MFKCYCTYSLALSLVAVNLIIMLIAFSWKEGSGASKYEFRYVRLAFCLFVCCCTISTCVVWLTRVLPCNNSHQARVMVQMKSLQIYIKGMVVLCGNFYTWLKV